MFGANPQLEAEDKGTPALLEAQSSLAVEAEGTAALPHPERLQLPLVEPDRAPGGKMSPIKRPPLKNACCPLAGFCARRGNGVMMPVWDAPWGQDSIRERDPSLSLALPGFPGSLGLGRASRTV